MYLNYLPIQAIILSKKKHSLQNHNTTYDQFIELTWKHF